MSTAPGRRLLMACAILSTPVFGAGASSGATLLRPAQVWTAGEGLHAGWVVLTEGKRIVAVGPASEVRSPAGAQRIELPGATLLPGL
ncbi:MAG: amidohydrolase family protein, partial [Steroidobacteraceae bacterium]